MLSTRITDLVDIIHAEEFYLDVFHRLCDPTTLSDNPDAIGIFHEFWNRLPDSKAIRTPAFFALCDFITSEDELNYNEGL